MKLLYIILFLSAFNYGVKAQNYLYTASTTGTNGTLVTTITSTGLDIIQNGGGCTVRVIYNTSVKFFNNSGVELFQGDPGVPAINTLQGVFRCNVPPSGVLKTSFFPIANNLGTSTNNLSSTFSMNSVSACTALTLDNVMCNTISFNIKFAGFSNTNLIVTGTSTLPIELITFDAYKKDREVELVWKTASELNNDYFTIEKSVDGMSWENIQTVHGAGNSSQVLDYSATDLSPYAGVSYYRLSQTDYDGTTEIFNIVSVQQDEVEELQAYPNPVSHSVTVLGVKDNEMLRILNTVGVEVTGNVIVSNSASKKTFIDMSRLPKGVYFIVNGEERLKVLKQ